MQRETKICQNCKNSFVIELADFAFYDKIKVPPPTFCPECRLQRRLLFMNERTFYKRNCDKCGKSVISMFPPGGHKKVYCSPCWWADDWGAEENGRDYDFSKPFFEQFAALYADVPEFARIVSESTLVRSDYSNICSYTKDCYLVFNSDYDEECSYCEFLEQSKFCLDVSNSLSMERCYGIINGYKCYSCTDTSWCDECVNVHFSRDLSGCSDCFGCVGLRRKSYCYFNEQLTKEGYEKKMAEWNLGSYSERLEVEKRLRENILKHPQKYMVEAGNSNVSGDFIFWAKNISNCYEVINTEDSKYCQFMTVPIKTADSYDFTMWGGGAERIYECMAVGNGQRDIKFCLYCWSQSTNLEYCWHINNSKNDNLFGCIGLRNKQYCILNKQYTKEEYEKLVPKIIEHMNSMPYTDAKGRIYKYGEFFPPELSPFAYNETVAQQFLPLTKEQAEDLGYEWKEPEKRNYQITITAGQLPDDIRDVDNSILEGIIGCAHECKCSEMCTEAFKITPSELEFHRRMNLPLPRLCPNCRYHQRLKKKNPIKLWHGKCQCAGPKSANGIYNNQIAHFHNSSPCPNEFETSYAPDRPEIVYCESCYNSEVA